MKKNHEDENTNFVTLVVPFEKSIPVLKFNRTSLKTGEISIQISEKGMIKKAGYNLN